MRVYFDTNCVIYLVERDPVWLPKVQARLAQLYGAGDQLVVGHLTQAECLVGPFISGNAAVEATYRAFFADSSIHVLAITAPICERAARLRAAHRFEMVDALHLATAIEHGCGRFLTNDTKLSRCTDIAVEILT